MCLIYSNLSNYDRWNWDGDCIVFDSRVPSARPVVGAKSLTRQYPIDVREFLVTENNAVMRAALAEDVTAFIRESHGDQALFEARKKTAFDYRAHMIASFVAHRIRYQSRGGRDPWQFPDETLFLKSGDCEDRAFLIASLLLASGVSNYNVRVAIGQVRHWRQRKMHKEYDHAWVMYKSEAGQWLLLEPLQIHGKRTSKSQLHSKSCRDEKVEYLPQYLFNDRHLWRVEGSSAPKEFGHICMREWSRINPKFAGMVHQSILSTALTPDIAPQWIIDGLNRHFHRLFFLGPIIENVDNPFLHNYDPREHFDNAFIREGWDLVNQRLDAFKREKNDLSNFALAAHAISDFYAHTSYVHFARLINPENKDTGHAILFIPQALEYPIKWKTLFETQPDYSAGSNFDLTDTAKYSVNAAIWKQPSSERPRQWQGKLISGRYAQTGDAKDITETLVGIPKALLGTAGFNLRGSLPHHNEITVDQDTPGKHHKLYLPGDFDGKDRMCFANQFHWRKNSAIEHIRHAFMSTYTQQS